ncbi:HemK2/MTQ2 family protein methyltransferase [Streptomyces sp. TRM 70361]|uniref:HemK2/MTQ2 family protein methyltransferase n=1 Tax=Streptomyces sp. TRM 70361 TaxID=3116553 RepID=UPI002E7B9870|nr:HemK2/MTQ2 family protein methyltransferase [Streptomyces sp. TRM 70361]MEE1942081.1 HemK2/MTQ2 family protein methyltransferase [Streptomyces sp. TRM 70361]
MFLLRPPGVYAPQDDTWLLRQALRDAALAPRARVLDLCTGTGVLAMSALRMGAAEAVALDASPRAVLAARCNARLHRLPLRVRRGDLADAVTEAARGGRFDVVLANPPYVPSPDAEPPRRGPALCWDAGPDGRTVLDRLCGSAPELLVRGGALLLVHSELCGTETTLAMLRERGMKSSVVARAVIPFGPVLRGRAAWLEERGLIAPGQRTEELVVVRGDLP